MNNIYLFCGKPGVGKTTYAKRLNKEYGIAYFSFDDFIKILFPEVSPLDRPNFKDKLYKSTKVIIKYAKQLLDLGLDVILDLGFYTKKDRNYVNDQFKNYNIQLIYFDLSDEAALKNLDFRNHHLQENEFYISKDSYYKYCEFFEKPSEQEKFLLCTSYEDVNSVLFHIYNNQ